MKGWVIPPKHSARFVWRMEAVLDLYEEPYDPKRPVVCFDERPCQLLAEVREPSAMGRGRPERRDHEYQRRGTAHLFVAFKPSSGWRSARVAERRRGCEFAEEARYLAEEVYPEAEKIRLVMDNLNVHTPAAFYESFPPEQAHRLARRIEFCYTPVHGSWLNMAEIEISVLVPPVPRRPTYPGRGNLAAGSARLERGAQPIGSECGVALHDRRRPDEAAQALSTH